MCVESHGNVNNDEASSTTANVDVMVEKIDSNTRTNTYETNPYIVTSTSFLIETNQPASTTNRIDDDEPGCRANGILVCKSSTF